MMTQLKVAIIGQSPFAAEVYKLLRQNGHKVTGVFTIPDKGNREDPLGTDMTRSYQYKIEIKNSANTSMKGSCLSLSNLHLLCYLLFKL